MARAFGIVTSSGTHIKVEGLQQYRPIGAFSFLGRYRVIDFPISNMSNSGIDRIQVYVKRKPRSLVEHLGADCSGASGAGKYSITRGSAFMAVNVPRSSSRHVRSTSRGVGAGKIISQILF